MGSATGAVFLYLIVPFFCPADDNTPLDELRTGQMKLNVLLTGVSAANALMALVFFPSRPPIPPSASALNSLSLGGEQISLVGTLSSWRSLLANRSYVILLLCYAVGCGLVSVVSTIITSNLAPLGVSQATAGWTGAAGNGGGLILGILAGVAADRVKTVPGRLKWFLVATVAVSGACFAAFATLLSGVTSSGGTPWSTGGIWLVTSLFAFGIASWCAAIPIFFDLAAEHTYPVPEGAMLMGMTVSMNIVAVAVLSTPAASLFVWGNWATAGVIVFATVLLGVGVNSTLSKMEYDVTHNDELVGQQYASMLLHR